MRGLALVAVAALAGCGKQPDFDARYASHAATIEASANRMESELARQIELANSAEQIETQPPAAPAGSVAHPQQR